jgi:hypothetical protein
MVNMLKKLKMPILLAWAPCLKVMSTLTISPRSSTGGRDRDGRRTSQNSAVEGEREKRDDKAHAGQCNYDLDHAGSIGRKFLIPGESL